MLNIQQEAQNDYKMFTIVISLSFFSFPVDIPEKIELFIVNIRKTRKKGVKYVQS